MKTQIDPTASTEANAFALQQTTLQRGGVAIAAPTHRAPGAEHAVPGHDPRSRHTEPSERVADGARGARVPDELSDLPVGGDPAARNAPHQRVHRRVEIGDAAPHAGCGNTCTKGRTSTLSKTPLTT